MVTIGFGICLCVSIVATLLIALRRDEQIDSYDWSIALLIPFIILGYWLKTQIATQEAALVLFAFINLTTTVMLAIILFAMLNRLRISISPWLKTLVYAASFAQLLPVWDTLRRGIPEDLIQITDTGDGYATRMVGGSFMFTHLTFMLAMLIVIIGIVSIFQARKKNYSRRTLMIFMLLVGAGIAVYAVEYVLDTNFSSIPYLYMTGDVVIALNYDRVHVHDISNLISDNQIQHNTRGLIAIGNSGAFLSANEKSFEFLPELRNQRLDAPLPEDSEAGKIIRGILKGYADNGVSSVTFQSGEMTCSCDVSTFTLHRGGTPRGYLLDIRDVTEENRNLDILTDFNRKLNREVTEKTRNIEKIQEKIVLGLADMVENRDSNTGGHIKRTSDVIRILVEDILAHQYFPVSETLAEDIERAAPMHDLGKVSIDSGILNKPGRLTPEEFAIMKNHSTISGQMVHILLEGVEEQHFVDTAYHVARYHHERWDGKGYPEGLVGEMIPLEARIMAVADVYDALVSRRVYKEPMSFEQAAGIMIGGMGTQFDPGMLLVFLNCQTKLEQYYSFIASETGRSA